MEDGALDRLDKRVSSPLFRLVVPQWAEAMMTIPGTWSGIPPFSMSLLPIIVGAVAEVAATGSLFGGVTASAALALSVALYWWTSLLRSATFEKGPAQVHKRIEDRRTCVCSGGGTGKGERAAEGRGGRARRVARVRAREAAPLTHPACVVLFFFVFVLRLSALPFLPYYPPIQAYMVHEASKKVFMALLVLPLTITYLPFHVLGKRRMG